MKVFLHELEPKLTKILEELMVFDLERRPYVIVGDVVTRRFVQFIRRYRPKTGELLFDVPQLKVYLCPCPDPQTGANWAVSTFAGAFSLPSEAVLSLRIDGDPLS